MEQNDPNQIPNQTPTQNPQPTSNPFQVNQQTQSNQPAPQEEPHKKSPLKLLVILVLILVFLGVAWFAAKSFVFNTNNQSQTTQQTQTTLLPAELSDYDIGQNADSFAIFKADQNVQNLLSESDFTKPLANIQAILYLLNSDKQSSVVILKTDTSDNASKLKDSITNQSALNPLSTYKISQKDNAVIAEIGGGLADFTGKISDNPAYTDTPIPATSNYFVVNFNHQKTPDLSQIYFSPINQIVSDKLFSQDTSTQQAIVSQQTTATQPVSSPLSPAKKMRDSLDGLLSFIKGSQINAYLDSNALNVTMTWNMFANSDINQAQLLQSANNSTQTAMSPDTQQVLALYQQLKTNLQAAGLSLNGAATPLNLKVNISDNNIIFNITNTLQDLTNSLQSISSSMDNSTSKTQDTARTFDLNKVVTALETYKVDHNQYPTGSSCVDKMQELKSYFTDGAFPTDPAGTQTIGTLDCQSGYYYQAFGGSRYILWAKMANSKDGNTYKEPETIATMGFDQLNPDFDGSYFVIKMDANGMSGTPTQDTSSGTSSVPHKFKRKK